jgi:hypothetical protein
LRYFIPILCDRIVLILFKTCCGYRRALLEVCASTILNVPMPQFIVLILSDVCTQEDTRIDSARSKLCFLKDEQGQVRGQQIMPLEHSRST